MSLVLRVSKRPTTRTVSIRKAADPNSLDEDRLRELIRDALDGLGNDQLVEAVLAAVALGNYSGLPDILDWAEFIARLRDMRILLADTAYNAGVNEFSTLLETALKQTADAAKVAAAASIKGQIGTTFTLIDANVVDWAERFAARFVVEISEDIRQSINLLVTESVSGFLTPQQLAREIKQFIPLHTRFANAVVKYRERMYIQAINEGRSLTAAAEFADRMAQRYAKKLAGVRSRVIARTEIMSASAQGKLIGWQAAADKGLLTAGWQKEWVTAEDERVCPVCGPMDHVKVTGWDGTFPNGFVMPPAHPNCRCDAIMVPEEVPAWVLR